MDGWMDGFGYRAILKRLSRLLEYSWGGEGQKVIIGDASINITVFIGDCALV